MRQQRRAHAQRQCKGRSSRSKRLLRRWVAPSMTVAAEARTCDDAISLYFTCVSCTAKLECAWAVRGQLCGFVAPLSCTALLSWFQGSVSATLQVQIVYSQPPPMKASHTPNIPHNHMHCCFEPKTAIWGSAVYSSFEGGPGRDALLIEREEPGQAGSRATCTPVWRGRRRSPGCGTQHHGTAWILRVAHERMNKRRGVS